VLIGQTNPLDVTLQQKESVISTHLDLDVLRTLVSAQDLGSFQRAAREVGRSQSAVSQQLRRVEEQLGHELFRKNGRRLLPTEAGELILGYARRLLALNDEAVRTVRGQVLEGVVRFGLPADFAESWLPAALGRFNRAHPSVRIEAVVDRNRKLLERLDQGELDLVLALGSPSRPDAQPVAALPQVWIGPAAADALAPAGQPIPLAVFEAPCFFRQAALATLERAGLPWRIAFVSPSIHGLWAAVEAGLGVTLRTPVGLPPGVRILGDRELPRPAVPPLSLSLHDRRRTLGAAGERLRAILLEELGRKLAGTPPADLRRRTTARSARSAGRARRRRR
jgi:DNA-binding transcriptional LysR family regulator